MSNRFPKTNFIIVLSFSINLRVSLHMQIFETRICQYANVYCPYYSEMQVRRLGNLRKFSIRLWMRRLSRQNKRTLYSFFKKHVLHKFTIFLAFFFFEKLLKIQVGCLSHCRKVFSNLLIVLMTAWVQSSTMSEEMRSRYIMIQYVILKRTWVILLYTKEG